MLNKFAGNLMRSAVELADLWRSDKIGRKLDAMMITADENTLPVSYTHLGENHLKISERQVQSGRLGGTYPRFARAYAGRGHQEQL